MNLGDDHVKLRDGVALRRFTDPDDFVRTVVVLSSEDSRQIIGHDLIIGGHRDL